VGILPMKMIISVLAADDIESIKPLWEALNKEHYNNSNHWKKHFAEFTFEKRIKTILKKEKHAVFISTMHQEITGYCIVSIDDDVGEVDSIFVKENYRKSSVGKSLIEKSIEWFENQNVESIKVGIAEGNESVLPFYEKQGFTKSMTILKKV
jgi:diamine N-acetyltransferase